MKFEKLDWYFIFVSLSVTIMIGVHSKFDLFFGGNDQALIQAGWYQFVKQLFLALPIGGGLAFLILYIKKLLIEHSTIIRNINDSRSKLEEAKNEFVQSINMLHEKITKEQGDTISAFFSHKPFNFFLDNISGTGVIGTLIMRSIKGGLTTLKQIEPYDYMPIIWEAISLTKSFCGVNRKPIKSFYKDFSIKFHLEFHSRLNEINPKGRIFVIDESDKKEFEAELADYNFINKFQNETFGINTFYIYTNDLRRLLGINDEGIIYDFGIYDNLIIRYDYFTKELNYKIKRYADQENKIYLLLFDKLLKNDLLTFKPIFLYYYISSYDKAHIRSGYKLENVIYSLHEFKKDNYATKHTKISTLLESDEWEEFKVNVLDFKSKFNNGLSE